MAKILNVDRAKYLDKNIEIYTQNKIGQYSKFLDRQHIYVTYFPINHQQTMVDVGTGGIESELGTQSPIRFNQVDNFPVSNFPELRPDIIFDETGYDIDLDISDLTILPNTIKPSPGDYMIYQIPGTKQILFRVNNIKYVSIQSNDFYQIDCDIKRIGDDVYKVIEPQVVDKFTCIFDNIGTQDKCIIRTNDIEKLNNIAQSITEILQYYRDMFYINETNTFVLNKQYGYPQDWMYDIYLERFLTDSKLYTDNEEIELNLVFRPQDNPPLDFDMMYRKSLWYAILTRNKTFLNPYMYYYPKGIIKNSSVFKMYDYPVSSVALYSSLDELYPKPPEDVPEGMVLGDAISAIKTKITTTDSLVFGDLLMQTSVKTTADDGTVVEDTTKQVVYKSENVPDVVPPDTDTIILTSIDYNEITAENIERSEVEYDIGDSSSRSINVYEGIVLNKITINGNEIPTYFDNVGDIDGCSYEYSTYRLTLTNMTKNITVVLHYGEPRDPYAKPDDWEEPIGTGAIANLLKPEPEGNEIVMTCDPLWCGCTTIDPDKIGCCGCVEVKNVRMGEYFPISLIQLIKGKNADIGDYIDKIIVDYMNNTPCNIDKNAIMTFITNALPVKVYYYTPIILYILDQYYNEYFTKPLDI